MQNDYDINSCVDDAVKRQPILLHTVILNPNTDQVYLCVYAIIDIGQDYLVIYLTLTLLNLKSPDKTSIRLILANTFI